MIQKKKIYYARTYRHLAFNRVKCILYFLLLIVPAVLVYLVSLRAITYFIAEIGVTVLDGAFPGVTMEIVTVRYPVFGTVAYIAMPTVLPDFLFVAKNLCVVLGGMCVLCTGRRKGHPVAVYLVLSMMTHVISCVFFLFGAEVFPYQMDDFSELYISQQISIWLIFIILTGLVTGFVGNRGYLYKILTFFAIMSYSIVFGGVRYLVFLFVLERYSMLYMAVMFFVFGPLFDFLYLVWIYSFFANKMIRYFDNDRGREEWRWS